MTFVEQLVLPFFMLVPIRWCRVSAAVLEIGFQLMIVGTGNYAWINFIGLLPCLSMLDDGILQHCFSRRALEDLQRASTRASLAGASTLQRCTVRVYRSFRRIVYVLLFLFMVYKSKDPIKEMFGAAPWINNYDQWFLMNSQGVFGFINQHRVQVVLKYTHADNPGSPDASWSHLDFKCLPGDPTRRPCFMSPYHYRLDWETWIRVTASLENLWEQRAPAEAYHQRLPEFLQALLVQILSGDDDAAGLMGVPRRDLFLDGRPPSAISVDFASYTYSAKTGSKLWGANSSAAEWYVVEPVAKDSLRAYGAQGHKLPESQVVKTSPNRHWVLGICALGLASALEDVAGHPGWSLRGIVASFALVYLFIVALAGDYENAWGVAEKLMPAAQQFPACLQVGALARQRCGAAYSLPAALLCGFLSTLAAGRSASLRKTPNSERWSGAWLVVCLAFGGVAALSCDTLWG